MVDADPAAQTQLSMNNLVLRILSAVVLAPLAILAAYQGGWTFVLFWGVAAIAVLWEWITIVVGPTHRLMFLSCGGAIAIAGFVAWLGRPVVAILMVGLGGLAALGRPGIVKFGLDDIGQVDGAFPLDDLAVGILLALAHVLFDHVRAFDNTALLLADHRNHPSSLALVSPGDHNRLVTFLNVK